MKTNSTIWNGQHAIAPVNSNESYPEATVSFMDFLLDSQRNNFYPEKTHTLIAIEDKPEKHLVEVQWFKDEYGLFNLLWRGTSDSSDWMPLEIDSFMLTTQVNVA